MEIIIILILFQAVIFAFIGHAIHPPSGGAFGFFFGIFGVIIAAILSTKQNQPTVQPKNLIDEIMDVLDPPVESKKTEQPQESKPIEPLQVDMMMLGKAYIDYGYMIAEALAKEEEKKREQEAWEARIKEIQEHKQAEDAQREADERTAFEKKRQEIDKKLEEADRRDKQKAIAARKALVKKIMPWLWTIFISAWVIVLLVALFTM